jgi:hypothetical protein
MLPTHPSITAQLDPQEERERDTSAPPPPATRLPCPGRSEDRADRLRDRGRPALPTWVDIGAQQDRRDRVPEVMESDRRQPSSLGLADEQARRRLRVKWPAVLGGDDQARVGVVGVPGQPLGRLTGAVSTQRVHTSEPK